MAPVARIEYCFNEHDVVIKHLEALCEKRKIVLERKRHLTPGDYIVTTDAGAVLIIERKTVKDAWRSIVDKEEIDGKKVPKLYRQVKEVVEASKMLPNSHPFLLVEWSSYIPKFKVPQHIVRRNTLTALSMCSKFVKIVISADPEHTAQLLVKLATDFDDREILG
jgi:ERCC4-type nuclease